MNVKVFKPFLLLLTVVVVVGLACGPFSTPSQPSDQGQPPAQQPQDQQPPVQPPEVQPTQPPPPAEPPAASAPEYYTEEWDTDNPNWSTEIELNAKEGDTSQANVNVDGGRLIFDLGKWLIAYKFYDPHEYTDVKIDVRVENRGTNKNNVLLVCRASEEGLYLVNIANSGLFAMYAYDGYKKSYARIADGGSNKIKVGKEINDYTLVCKDRTLILYINGFETRKYTDNQYALRKGKVGVGVASEDQVPVKLEFEYVTISEP
jgi:hypothetical protein